MGKDRSWSMENGHKFQLGEAEIEQIQGFYLNNHLSDVLFMFPAPEVPVPSGENGGSKSLPAHRLLLSLRSGAFRNAFRDNSTSYTSIALGEKRLRLPLKMVIHDTSYDIFKELLRYIYTGTLQSPPNSTQTNGESTRKSPLVAFWLDLLKAAARFDIPSLSILCIEEIEELLSQYPQSAMDILHLIDAPCFQEIKPNEVLQATQKLEAHCMDALSNMPDSDVQKLLLSSHCSTDRLLRVYHRRTKVPLVLAIQHQNFRVVDALLSGEDDQQLLKQADNNNILPLVAAMNTSNDAMIRRVLIPSAKIWTSLSNTPSGWFLMACASGVVLHCKILVESHGADVNMISSIEGSDDFGNGQTPLHIASHFGNVEVIKYLLSLNAVPNFQDNGGNTPLHYASSHLVAEVFLTQNGKCNPNIPNSRGRVPLHQAAARGDIGVVNLLLQKGADLSIVDEEGQTPFHVAAANGHASVCLILIKTIEDRQVKPAPSMPPKTDLAEPLGEIDVEPPFDINSTDYKSNTPLHLAAMAPQARVEKMVQVLLENGADPNCANWFGYTPLHLFCAHQDGPTTVIDMFIEHGTNIQLQSLDGSTPLHLAVGKASESITIALVRAGAPVYVQDVAGRSVVNLAETTSQGIMVVPLLLNVKTPPPWVTDDSVQECLSCGEGFGMAMRKHHCRHCGRIICGKCSTNRIPLPKFDQQAASRVCDICFDVLSFRKLM